MHAKTLSMIFSSTKKQKIVKNISAFTESTYRIYYYKPSVLRIRDLFDLWIRDPGWVFRILDPQPIFLRA